MFSGRLSHKYSSTLDDEAKSYLQKLQKSADRMEVLIRDILAFSKISFETKSFQLCDLNTIFEQTVSDLDLIMLEKNATVNSDPLPEICADAHLMRLLFFNLIGNAIKYAKPNTPPVVHIDSDFSDNGKEKYCRIYFRDNGIGFDQKYATKIFEIFTRLHGQSEFEGSGIGLALCKRIVEKHDGFITAISTQGEGSTFIVSLPVERDSAKKQLSSGVLSQ